MDIKDKIEARVKELGRNLTPQELIEVINEPDESGEGKELIYESDEGSDVGSDKTAHY